MTEMKKHIYDENNGLWYKLIGDYYIPVLTLSSEEQRPIGKWGRLHRDYLKEHHPIRFNDLVLTGTIIDAYPHELLIKNVFFNKAPLHDGALIVRNNRLYAAGCLLPLSSNMDIVKDLGTRHRAAIGMSENSDAVVVVVSEETGTVSIAVEGILYRGYNKDSLKAALRRYLISEFDRQQGKRSLGKLSGKKHREKNIIDDKREEDSVNE